MSSKLKSKDLIGDTAAYPCPTVKDEAHLAGRAQPLPPSQLGTVLHVVRMEESSSTPASTRTFLVALVIVPTPPPFANSPPFFCVCINALYIPPDFCALRRGNRHVYKFLVLSLLVNPF